MHGNFKQRLGNCKNPIVKALYNTPMFVDSNVLSLIDGKAIFYYFNMMLDCVQYGFCKQRTVLNNTTDISQESSDETGMEDSLKHEGNISP